MLKIEGFAGKFQPADSSTEKAVSETPASSFSGKEAEKLRPSASFKLKKAFAETAQNYEVKPAVSEATTSVVVEGREAFDVEKLELALDEYIRIHKPETTVSVALKSHKPLLAGEKIVIQVDNKLQWEKLENLRLSLQNMLMKKLNNGSILLSFDYFDDKAGEEVKKPITAQAKLELFMELNPVVRELKKRFGLELE